MAFLFLLHAVEFPMQVGLSILCKPRGRPPCLLFILGYGPLRCLFVLLLTCVGNRSIGIGCPRFCIYLQYLPFLAIFEWSEFHPECRQVTIWRFCSHTDIHRYILVSEQAQRLMNFFRAFYRIFLWLTLDMNDFIVNAFHASGSNYCCIFTIGK